MRTLHEDDQPPHDPRVRAVAPSLACRLYAIVLGLVAVVDAGTALWYALMVQLVGAVTLLTMAIAAYWLAWKLWRLDSQTAQRWLRWNT